MLYISCSNGVLTGWRVGNLNPVDDSINLVYKVEADGDELDYIKNRFQETIPRAFGRETSVMRWFGDHAKFIVANLC